MMKLVSLILLCFAASAICKADSYVDDTGTEQLARLVCHTTKGTKNLIGRLSSVERLVEFLKGLRSENQLFKCREEYLESIEDLVNLVKGAARKDACGEAILDAIERYHRKYVSKVDKHLREQKKGGSKAPKMIKLFFMQYATEISSICEQNTLKFLDNCKVDQHSLAKVEQLRKFTDSLGMTDLRKGYNGIYLFWNMIDALDLSRRSAKFSKYVIPGGPESRGRVNVQMRDARPILGVQALCRYQLRPVYSKTLLPLLRLIDLGYYPHGSNLVDRLNEDSVTRSLFFATQICETILPVVVYSDEKLPEDGFVALSWADASSLVRPQIENIDELISDEPQVDLAPVILNQEPSFSGEPSLETIKDNVDSRGKILNRMLKQMLKQTKNQLKALFKGYKLFRKDQHSLVPLNDAAEGSWQQIEEELEIKQEEEEEGNPQERRRRGFIKNFFATIFVLIVAFFYTILTVFFKIILFTLPALVMIPFAIAGDKGSRRTLKQIFSLHWDGLYR